VRARFGTYKRSAHNAAALDACQEVARHPEGWVVLWGHYGTGKTHLLAATVNEAVKSNIAAVYYTLPDLLDRLRGSYDRNEYDPFLARLCSVPILAIDEIDKARATAWANEKIYQMIDARYRAISSQATMFAMNSSPQKTGDDMDYIYSRMNDWRSRVIEITGGDVRPIGGRIHAG